MKGLERFYPKIKELGITENNFTDISFHDYDNIGITESSDRKKLFKLIGVSCISNQLKYQ
jgi:hypothetical protein